MALPSIAQEPAQVSGSADTLTISFGSASTGGNAIAVFMGQWSSGTRSYTWSDDGSNTYVQQPDSFINGSTSRHCNTAYVLSASAATDLDNTVVSSTGNTRQIGAFEIADADAFDASDQDFRNSNGSSHFSAPSGEVDTSDDVFCWSVGIHNASAGTVTQGSGWTQDELNGGFFHSQHRIDASALTDQRGDWSSTSSRQMSGAIAVFRGAAATVIAVPAGSLAFAGQTPSLDFELHPAAGALVVAGAAPEALVGFAIEVPAGALLLAGQTPTRVEDSRRQPGAAALQLQGQAPELAYVVPAPAGALQLAGLQPTLDRGIPVPAGSLTLAGLAPVVVAPVAISVPAGALVLAGLTPSLDFGVDVPAGTLTLAGLAPQALESLTIPVPAGALALVGQGVSLAFGLPVPAGVLTLAGLAPDVGQPVSIAVPAGALTLTGQTPALGFGIDVPAGSLVLAGLAPTAVAPVTIDVPVGALVLAGLAPAVVGGGDVLEPGSGVLSFVGLRPRLGFAIVLPEDDLPC